MPFVPRRRQASSSIVAVLLATLLSCVLLQPSSWADPQPVTPSPSPAGTPAPGLGTGGEAAATTVGIRTSGEKAPDDRGTYSYEIAPGAYKIDYVAVTNYSLHPVDVRLLAEDATSTADTAYAAVTSGPQRGVGAWTLLATSNVTIPAHATQIIPFQISPPRNATPGDHPGAIIVSLLAQQPQAGGGQVVVDHRVGLRVSLRVPGELVPRLEIDHLRSTFRGGWSGFGVGRMTSQYLIVNKGNVTLSADQVDSYARSMFLGDVQVKVAPTSPIVPGGSIAVTVTGRSMFAIGPVRTHVKVIATSATAGITLPSTTATVTTWVIPWIPVWIVVAILLLWLGWREWRRRHPRKTGRRAVQSKRRSVKAPSAHRAQGEQS